ncbi:MAG: dihydrofolate reductase family protein [Actinobacteria bacterium]|nr:dihydrofolate reductase family protein [Actinomycetota bacterium]
MGIVTADISVTLDGYGAGPNQRSEAPFGDIDEDRLHSWMFEHATESPAEIAAITEAAAYIMGRNMFSPGRGEWDLTWKGWWGEEPPYHAPVYVLTNHEREPVPMKGGTTFNFITDGIVSALDHARAAAGSGNIAIAGGATTINQYLSAGLIDELRLHVVPFAAGVGGGSRIFDGVPPIEFDVVAARHTPYVTHLTYLRPGLSV